MGGFGFGTHAVVRKRPRNPPQEPTVPLPVVSPSAGWTGVAGSGFTAVPTDPVRTTAKPAMRLLVPTNQYFTDELLVGVIAGANNAGSLLTNMGLEKVVLHCEGTAVDILAPSHASFSDANGNTVTYYGWWAILKKPVGASGHANVYFEAVPLNTTMQRRVIGPYQFSPVATLYDCELEVAPTPVEIVGTRYKSIGAALAYIRTNGRQNTRITITEAHPSGFHGITSPGTYQSNGRHRIEATVPVSIGFAAYVSDAANFINPGVNGLHFKGSNVTLDFAYTLQLYRSAGAGSMLHWLDGCTITNSLGRAALWRLGTIRTINGHKFVDGAWFTECAISNLQDVCNQKPPLVRGCTFTNLASDLTGDAQCFVGNTVIDHDSSDYARDVPAFTLTYTGAETTATIELAGGNDSSSRTWTARWGANSATFIVQNTYAAWLANTNYKFSHVVNWLNGLGVGFAAVLLDDSRRATTGCKLATQGIAFAATNVKSTTLTLYSMFDLHSDMYQTNNAPFGADENVVIMNNRGWELVAQNVFMSPIGGTVRDYLIINNALANKVPGGSAYNNTDNYYSAQTRVPQSHIVFAHNTFTNQGVALGDATTTFDSYCLIANNAFRSIHWGGTPDADLVLKDNHIHTGKTAPTYATGTTIGGDQASLVASYDTGDFTPAGALLSNLKAPVVKYDRTGVARGATAPAGALA